MVQLKPIDDDHNMSLKYRCACGMTFYADLENAKLPNWRNICIVCKKVNQIEQIKEVKLGITFTKSKPKMKPVYQKSLNVLLGQGYNRAVAVVAIKKASENVRQETVTEIVKEALKEIR